jgi:1-acyl-sn-glycerol-3-phosphate acyltransferase
VIYVVRYALCALYTLFWAILAILATVVDRKGGLVIGIAHTWIRWVFATCNVTVEARGLENVRPDQPYVFMSNHQSVWDIAGLIATLPVSWRFVAKKELTWIPFFGWALYLHGHVIVDRGNRQKAVASLERAAERVRQGLNVVIFPEGTRSETGTMREFKSGGFHLALQAGVPILPVSVSGGRNITRKRSLKIEGGHLTVVYGKPIPTAGLSIDDRNGLKAEVRRAITEGLI